MGEVLRQRLKQKKFESPAHEAMLALMVTASQVQSDMDKVCASFGISSQQYNILRILRGAENDGSNGRSCGEIAERMIDRAPDVTRRIDALVKAGLVERDRSDEDRRVVLTRITKKGLTLLEKMHPEVSTRESKILEKVPQQDLAELTRVCEQLLAAVQG
jgi:DNA-binding MarR family transcriptional regulator